MGEIWVCLKIGENKKQMAMFIWKVIIIILDFRVSHPCGPKSSKNITMT